MTRTQSATAILAVMMVAVFLQGDLRANHPVIVEGTCLGPGSLQRTTVVPGTCGDYDGDGFIGTAEDVDGPDRVFGTITAALGPGTGAAAGTGANQNGRVVIVASGHYPEVVTITAANGNVILEGAPGVEVNIDAIVQGVAGGAGRQNAPGIVVNAPENRYVVIRNVTVRNWASGIVALGVSRVSIERVRLDSNANYGVEVRDTAQVSIANSEVHGTGRRVGAGTDFPVILPPEPGNGIDFSDAATGTVYATSVTHSVGAGVTGKGACVDQVNVFGNSPDLFKVKTCSLPR